MGKVWTVSANPFANGYNVPDVVGGYSLWAMMDDGGQLCEWCATDPDNPVTDQTGAGSNLWPDGWGLVGWFTSGDVDDAPACDHCGRGNATADRLRHGADRLRGLAARMVETADTIGEWVADADELADVEAEAMVRWLARDAVYLVGWWNAGRQIGDHYRTYGVDYPHGLGMAEKYATQLAATLADDLRDIQLDR